MLDPVTIQILALCSGLLTAAAVLVVGRKRDRL